jgi:prepilin-type processing-associated H-X9-DG protein
MNQSRFSMPDLIASLLILLVIAFFSLAATVNLDSRETRVKCASNLRQIGQAILLYSNDNRGPYPRTIYDPNHADHPTAYTGVTGTDPYQPGGPNPNDVSAALYNLLRTEDITSRVFVCPAAGQHADVFGGGIHTALDQANFPSGDVLSYSYANPYPSEAARNLGYNLVQGLAPTFAVAADMNPGSAALLQLTPDSPMNQMRDGNSPNHGGNGQNVLYGDGHVEFQNNPFAGANRDNIYTYGDSGTDPNINAALPTGGKGIWGSPVGPNDSVLLPAAIMPAPDPNAPAAPPAASGAPAPPAAAAPIPPIDPGTDVTTFIAISSLIFVVILVIILTMIALRRKKRSVSDNG